VSSTRILCIAPFGDYGGSEMVLMRVLRALDDSIDVRLVVLTPGPFADMLVDEGYAPQIENLHGKRAVLRFPALVRSISRRYRDSGIQLVHANGIKAALLGVPVARRLGVPVIWMKHDHFYDGRFARAVARRCDRVVVVSEAMAEQFRPELDGRLSVIYPGVRLAPPAPPTPTEPLVVAVGRLDPRKGFANLLRAGRLLRDRGYDARMRIAGPVDRVFPRHAAELDALVDELGMREYAKVGWVDDIDSLYRRARVVAMASPPNEGGKPSEGAPTVLMEAMGHARPVVGPRQAGIAEVVGDVGTLVDEPTPEGLADGLEAYIADARMADEVGRRGRERAERLYSFDRTLDQLTELWRTTAAEHSAQSPVTSEEKLSIAGRVKEPLKRLAGDRGVLVARRLGRFRPLLKARRVREEGVRFRDRPADVARFVLFDPETHSYSYDLGNVDELVEFCSSILDVERPALEGYVAETQSDPELNERLRRRTRWRVDAKSRMPLGNRLLWYLLTRATKPRLTVETGIFDGLGSLMLLRALERNAEEGTEGRLVSIDIDPDAGWLVPERVAPRWERIEGDIFEDLEPALRGRSVDLLIHDSVHTEAFQRFEFDLALRHGNGRVYVVDPSGSLSTVLRDLATERSGRYGCFLERPARHFYQPPGTSVAIFGDAGESTG
jgi:glycosyltransferase involved in cell wall biosynthesis